MCVDRNVACVPAAELGFGGAILDEVSGHPVILAGGGEIFDCFAEVAAMEFGAAFAGGTDENDGESGFEGHSDQRGFAVAGDAFDADFPGVDSRFGFEVIEGAGGTPGPGA